MLRTPHTPKRKRARVALRIEHLEARALLSAQPISLASASFDGASADGYSNSPSLSSDGQVMAFVSTAPDIVPDDTNGFLNDVFVRNQATGAVSLVSVDSAGTASGNNSSDSPLVSADGRYVLFRSMATDLTNMSGVQGSQLYRRDLSAGTTVLVTVNASGGGSTSGYVTNASMSADGRYVAFETAATDLTPNFVKHNAGDDIFVRDMVTGTTTLVSVNDTGTGSGNGSSINPVLSADGRFVAFTSSASDLVPNDTNNGSDIFVRDLQTNTTALVSINRFGTGPGDASSGNLNTLLSFNDTSLAISSDGRYIAFPSTASDLVANQGTHVGGIYVRDMQAGVTTLVTVNMSGTAGDWFTPAFDLFSMTPDGHYIAFLDSANDLVPNNSKPIGSIEDVYLRDMVAGTTTLITRNLSGTAGANASALQPFISDDGRYVVFQSGASNLVAGDTNNAADVFVYDKTTGTTSFASVNSSGAGPGNGASTTDIFGIYLNGYRLSANGQYVAFDSAASNLVSGDNNRSDDVFLRNLAAGTTTLASARSSALPAAHTGNWPSSQPAVSADGRYIAFVSSATDIVPDDFNYPDTDIFVYDRDTGASTLVSVNSAGTASANNSSTDPLISADGRYVFFESSASNLVANQLPDPTGSMNIFRRDLQTGTTIQVTRSADGQSAANGSIYYPSISPDGRYLVFSSTATNLVTGYSIGHAGSIYGDAYLEDVQTGVITLLSVDTTGLNGANADVTDPVVSADGQVVAFLSTASNLVPGDSGSVQNVFVRSLKTNVTIQLSSKPGDTAGTNYDSPSMSSDGRYVAFSSDATDLVSIPDGNGTSTSGSDVFVFDLQTGTTTLVSINAAGTASGDVDSNQPSISADGRYVAFESYADNLIAGATKTFPNVYVRDLQANTTTLVSVGTDGKDAGGSDPVISADGSTVAFVSNATTLVPGYVSSGAFDDLYVRNVSAGITLLATPSDTGSGGGNDLYPSGYVLDADGSLVVYASSSSNLYAGDFNKTTDVFAFPTVAGQGSISGQVFNDANGDGTLGAGESGLANWTVYLDLNNDGQLSAGEPTHLTDATGHYTFTGLSSGTFTVREVLQNQFIETKPAAPGSYTVTLPTDSSSSSGNDFGDKQVFADLVALSVSVPATVKEGHAITVTWTDKNQGQGAAAGWQDAVFLSTDKVLDPSDTLLGIVQVSGPLASGATAAEQLKASIAGLAPGSYHIIVQVDRRNEVAENTNESNNLTASPSALSVTIPTLTLGTPYSDSFTTAGDVRYYQVSAAAGQSMAIQVQSAASSGEVDVFVRYGALATPFDDDFKSELSEETSPFVLIPSLRQGTYSIMVRGAAGQAATSGFNITASLPGLSILQVSPNSGGDNGNATVRIDGTNLTPNTKVSLVKGGSTIAAANIDYESPSLLYATFNLSGQPQGSYDLKITDTAGSATRPGAFQVVPGHPSQLEVHLTTPQYARDNRPGIVAIDFTNTSNTDIIAPLFTLTSDQSVFQVADGSSPLISSSITVIGTSSQGPAGIIGPGQSGEVLVNITSTTTVRHAQIGVDLTVPEDPNEAVPVPWSTEKEMLKPPSVPDDAWNAIWSNFLPLVGTTIGDFDQAISNAASYFSQWGSVSTDTNNLLGYLIEEANDSLPVPILASAVDTSLDTTSAANFAFSRIFSQPISGRYRLGPLGRGWVGSWEISAMTDSDGNVTIFDAGTARYFADSNGTYSAQPGDSGTLTKNGGMLVLHEASGEVLVFNADGTLNYDIDTSGNRITASYSGGLMSKLTSNDGGSITFAYNGQGRLASTTDSQGHVVTYTYDSSGQELIQVTGPAGTTKYAYVTGQGAQSEHALASITFPDGTHETFSYDSKGRLIKQAGEGGNDAVSYSYTAFGSVTVTDAGGGASQYFFDDSNHVMEAVDPAGLVTRFTRDAAGNMIESIDPAGGIESFGYDSQNHPLVVTDQLGQTSTFSYDPTSGQISQMTDPKGNTTDYAFDASGNLVGTTYADGSSTSETYDADGTPATYTDARGQTITETHDSAGRLTSKTLPGGDVYTYTYDARGNMLTADDSSGTIHMTYDADDNLTEIDYPDGHSIKYTYDSAGRRLQMNAAGYVTNYTYDSIGRFTRLTDGSGTLLIAYTYDNQNRPIRADHGNGTYTTYAYNKSGQLTSLINYAPDASINSKYIYTYDILGRVATMTTTEGTTTYHYDATGQLISAALPGGRTITYSYDAAGNRVSVTDSGTTTTYQTNPLNEYTSSGAATFTYDADGNLTSRADSTGVTHYSYDAENRLTEVSGPAGTWIYEYDPFGYRTAVIENGVRTELLYDPSSQGTAVAEYAADGSVISQFAEGIGIVASASGGQTDYYDFDGIGSTAGVTDAAGNYVDQYSYLPFGEMTTIKGAVVNPFTYVGQLGATSDGSGLINMRARNYDPSTGQFVSNDPLGPLGGDTNIRRYAFNNPVSVQDPSGLGYFVGTGAWGVGEATPASFANGNAIELGHTEYITDSGEVYQFAVDDYVYRAPFNADPVTVQSQWVPPSGNLKPGTKLVPRDPNHPPGDKNQPPVILDPTHYDDDLVIKLWKQRLHHSFYSVIPFPWFGDISFENCHSFAQKVHGDVENLIAGDPNDIAGPGGYGANQSIDSGQVLPYAIDFENDPTIANAPAQDVVVTDQLDSNLDWSTFSLGPITIGNTTVAVPAGVSSFATELAYHNEDGSALRVDLSAALNLQTGVVTWTFHSIDPATGTFPLDPLAGFLPTDDSTHRGEAAVTYTVRAKPGLATGQKINASASIVFDINAPIVTNTFANTIDAGNPTSAVSPLPAITRSTGIHLAWSGSDDSGGAGIAGYDILVSTDGGPFAALMIATTATSATFTGSYGHTYAFESIAHDGVAHAQPTPASAQASTFLDPPVQVQFSQGTYSVQENGDSAVITLDRSGGLYGPVTVNVSPSGGSAVDGVNYQFSTTPVTLAAGQKSATVTIPIKSDGLYTADKTLGLVVTGSGIATVTATVVIHNTDAPPVTLIGGKVTKIKIKHKKVTVLVLNFSGALDPSTVSSGANYRLGTAGRDKRFGTRDDKRTKIASATYNAALHTITLKPRGRLVFSRLEIGVNYGDLRDASGRLIDGDGDGKPGGTALARVTRRGIQPLN
jgi:RHS repeat-associated protein